MKRSRPAKKSSGPKDLPGKPLESGKMAEVRGGRRVDFVEGYVNEIKLTGLSGERK